MSRFRIAVALFGPQGQGSFNESGWQGAERARAAGHALQVHWIEPPDAAGRAQALRGLCTPGLDLLVAHGGQGDVPVSLVAGDFPATRFAITQGGYTAPNVACYEVLQEQSAYLAGVFAALATRTGVVGHMSGEKVRPGLKGRAAFADGVRAGAAQAGRSVQFVTLFCGVQHDPALAHRAARTVQAAGADFIFAMIDGGRDGVSQACRETGMRQIGNVLDWVARDPQVFAASAIADSGRGVSDAIEDLVRGSFAPGTHRVTGMESPAHVDFVLGAEFQSHATALTDWRARLCSHAIRPSADYDGPELALVPA